MYAKKVFYLGDRQGGHIQTRNVLGMILSHFISYREMGCTASSDSDRYSVQKYNPDKYSTIAEVQRAIREAGLESSDLLFGIDFTGSNQCNV